MPKAKSRSYTLLVGTEYDSAGKRLPNPRSRVANLLDETARLVGGYTATPVRGGYVYKNGEVAHEKTLRLQLVTDKPSVVARLAKFAKELFQQEAVMVQSTPVTSRFY